MDITGLLSIIFILQTFAAIYLAYLYDLTQLPKSARNK